MVTSRLHDYVMMVYGTGKAGKTCGTCQRLERDPRHTGGIGCALSLDPMGKVEPWQPDWAACGAHKGRKEE